MSIFNNIFLDIRSQPITINNYCYTVVVHLNIYNACVIYILYMLVLHVMFRYSTFILNYGMEGIRQNVCIYIARVLKVMFVTGPNLD